MPAILEEKQEQDMVIMVKVQKPLRACVNPKPVTTEEYRAVKPFVWYNTYLKALWPVFRSRAAANKVHPSLSSPLKVEMTGPKLPVNSTSNCGPETWAPVQEATLKALWKVG